MNDWFAQDPNNVAVIYSDVSILCSASCFSVNQHKGRQRKSGSGRCQLLGLFGNCPESHWCIVLLCKHEITSTFWNNNSITKKVQYLLFHFKRLEVIELMLTSMWRYVGYVAKLRAAPFPPTRLRLTRLVLRPPPPSMGPITPHVKIYSPKVVPLQEIYRTPKEQRR